MTDEIINGVNVSALSRFVETGSPRPHSCPLCNVRPAVERGNGVENLCDPCFALWLADGEPEEARPAVVDGDDDRSPSDAEAM